MKTAHRKLFVAFLALAGAALVGQPLHAQHNPPCAHGLIDLANPHQCIPASSMPLNGTLLPLGPYFFVSPAGEVGIGTTTPAHRLHVAGDLRSDGKFAVGADATIGSNYPWDKLFEFSGTISDFSTSVQWAPLHSWITIDPTVDLTGANAKFIFGNFLGTQVASGNTRNIEYLEGADLRGFHFGTGELGVLLGAIIGAESTGDVTGLGQGALYALSDAYGSNLLSVNAGIEIVTGHRGSGGYINSNYGLYVYEPHATSPLGNHYGIYLEDQDFGDNDSYAIYSEGGTSYLEGDLGVGEPNPSAKLHVAGDLVATGTKNFVQPHPTDPSSEIWFVCLEGNEAGTYFRGTSELTHGRAVIPVPEEFAMTTESEGMTVQVTPMGPRAGLWVESFGLDHVVVRGDRDVRFSYMVNGVRRGYANYQPIRARSSQPKSNMPRQAPARHKGPDLDVKLKR